MAKKVVNVALHKKKPIKPMIKKGRKLKAIFKKFTHYMKTDSYMYSLLESTKPSRIASSGRRSYEPILRKKERTWLQGLEEFLKCDCYMYSPLCDDGSISDNSTKVSGVKQIEETGRIQDEMENTTPQSKHIAFKHVLVEHETVKRVVLQNGGSHVTGLDLLQEELDKVGAKRS